MKDHGSNGRNWARYQYQDTQELVSAFFQVIHEEILFKCSILPAYSPTGFLLLQNLTKPLASCEDKAWKKQQQQQSGLNGIRTDYVSLRYQCSAVPPELSSQLLLGSGLLVSS